MKTSHLYNQLQTLLDQSAAWADQRHLQTLIWMVIGVIFAECINLPKWTIYSRKERKICSKPSTTIQPLVA